MGAIRKIHITPDPSCTAITQVVRETIKLLSVLEYPYTASITFNCVTFEIANSLEMMALSAYDQAVGEQAKQHPLKPTRQEPPISRESNYRPTFGDDSCGQ